VVGDSARDLLTAVGLPGITAIYVRSGKPAAAELQALAAQRFAPAADVPDLTAAAAWILRRETAARS